MLQAALESGIQCCSENIYPVVLIGQNPGQIPEWMIRLNSSHDVLVLNHNASFAPRIAASAKNEDLSRHGAYLRLDIPVIMNVIVSIVEGRGFSVRSDFAFYTDCDVMILNVDRVFKPKILAMGPEVNKGIVYNTGVLFVNVTGFSEVRDGLIDYADTHRWEFGGCDQGLINEYFGGKREQLPDEWNWKPYWGINRAAHVVHFHGPKISRCVECLVKHRFLPGTNHSTICGCLPYNKALGVSRARNKLSFDLQMQSYTHYMSHFYRYLYEFGQRMMKLKLF